ncbi:MAG: hypothetical protein MK180_04475 [Rhodobacteraceae bacterium]|nr:hypothetical protein [Paracoccaceae bacterium]
MNIKAFIVALAATSMATTAFAGDPTDVGTDDDIIIPLPTDAGGSSVSMPILGSGAGGVGTLAIGAVVAAALIAALDSSGTTEEEYGLES